MMGFSNVDIGHCQNSWVVWQGHFCVYNNTQSVHSVSNKAGRYSPCDKRQRWHTSFAQQTHRRSRIEFLVRQSADLNLIKKNQTSKRLNTKKKKKYEKQAKLTLHTIVLFSVCFFFSCCCCCENNKLIILMDYLVAGRIILFPSISFISPIV